MADHGHPAPRRDGSGAVRQDEPVIPDGRPVREERVVVHEDRRGGGIAGFFGSLLKAGLWMILGVVVAVIVLLALIF